MNLIRKLQLPRREPVRTEHSARTSRKLKVTLRRLDFLLNRWYLANLRARPIFVPPLGYLIRLIAYKTLCLFLKRLKLNTSHARDENSTTPTRVFLGEIWKDATTRLTKLRHRRKLPRPEASILPEPSIKKAKSRRLRQTKKTKNR